MVTGTGTGTRFRERLVPGWRAWAVLLGPIAMLAIAYGAAFGAGIGWLLGLGASGLAALVLIATSPVVEVDAERLRVGSATLPRSSIASARAIDRDGIATARGPDGIPTAYAVLRASRSRRAVLVELADEADPHAAWLVTSARADQLAAALAPG